MSCHTCGSKRGWRNPAELIPYPGLSYTDEHGNHVVDPHHGCGDNTQHMRFARWYQRHQLRRTRKEPCLDYIIKGYCRRWCERASSTVTTTPQHSGWRQNVSMWRKKDGVRLYVAVPHHEDFTDAHRAELAMLEASYPVSVHIDEVGPCLCDTALIVVASVPRFTSDES